MRNTRAKSLPRLRIPFYNEGPVQQQHSSSCQPARHSPRPAPPPPGSGFPPLGGLSSAVTVAVILPPVRDSSYTLPPPPSVALVHDSQFHTGYSAAATRHVYTLATTATTQRPSVSPIQSTTAKVGTRPPDLSAHLAIDNPFCRIVASPRAFVTLYTFSPGPERLDSWILGSPNQ